MHRSVWKNPNWTCPAGWSGPWEKMEGGEGGREEKGKKGLREPRQNKGTKRVNSQTGWVIQGSGWGMGSPGPELKRFWVVGRERMAGRRDCESCPRFLWDLTIATGFSLKPKRVSIASSKAQSFPFASTSPSFYLVEHRKRDADLLLGVFSLLHGTPSIKGWFPLRSETLLSLD